LKQAKFFQYNFGSLQSEDGSSNVSKDLNTLDFLQQDLCYYKEEIAQGAESVNDNGPRILGKKPEIHI